MEELQKSGSLEFTDKTSYYYEVKLVQGCKLFDIEPFVSNMRKLGEMIITSQPFQDHQECSQNCMDLMTRISVLIQEHTAKRLVIATKINPLHDPLADGLESREGWRQEDTLKMFLSDAQALREENILRWDVCATVAVQHNHGIDLKNAPLNQPIL